MLKNDTNSFKKEQELHDIRNVLHTGNVECDSFQEIYFKQEMIEEPLIEIQTWKDSFGCRNLEDVEKESNRSYHARVCPHCKLCCSDERGLLEHIAEVHNKACKINCHMCMISYSGVYSDIDMEIHMIKCHGLTTYKCNMCHFLTFDLYFMGHHFLEKHADSSEASFYKLLRCIARPLCSCLLDAFKKKLFNVAKIDESSENFFNQIPVMCISGSSNKCQEESEVVLSKKNNFSTPLVQSVGVHHIVAIPVTASDGNTAYDHEKLSDENFTVNDHSKLASTTTETHSSFECNQSLSSSFVHMRNLSELVLKDDVNAKQCLTKEDCHFENNSCSVPQEPVNSSQAVNILSSTSITKFEDEFRTSESPSAVIRKRALPSDVISMFYKTLKVTSSTTAASTPPPDIQFSDALEKNDSVISDNYRKHSSNPWTDQADDLGIHFLSRSDSDKFQEESGTSAVGLRKQQENKLNRFKQKILRQRGDIYTSRKGDVKTPTKFEHIQCGCRLQCDSVVGAQMRKTIYDRFWNLGSWDAQTSFLLSAVTEVPVANHRHTPKEKQRSRTLLFNLDGRRVCKATFTATLGISKTRINYITQRKAIKGVCSPDKRGRHLPANKLSSQTIDSITRFLSSLPKFSSCYSDSNKLYFHPDLTVAKLHRMYCETNIQHQVGVSIFRREFTKFNVGIYIPKKGVCGTCDEHNANRKAHLSQKDLEEVERESKIHNQGVTAVRKYLTLAEEECSKASSKLLCFTFGLEKARQIPHLNASIACCKRKVWLYNVVINTRHNNKANMCVWTEADGKRGSNEVSSCLLAFLRTIDFNKYNRIESFSDSCGKMNRNETVVCFMIECCKMFPVDSWTHTYVESGHCILDKTDVGRIEKAKNANIELYTTDHWVQLMQNCKVHVIDMFKKFFDASALQNNYTFCDANTVNEKFSWQTLKWLRISKDKDNVMEYKTTYDPHQHSSYVHFSNKSNVCSISALKPLYTDRIKLSREKYKDILSLLPYVPDVYKSFFTEMPHEETSSAEEDVETYPD